MFDGVQPENDLNEQTADPVRRRVFAIIMMLVILIPSIVSLVEFFTGSLSTLWRTTIEPIIPEWLQTVHF